MLSLRLLGGISLTGPQGRDLGRASQRRRLALLAVLAVARGRSVTRDKLMALLWPEADSERARHLLSDSLYVLRDALGDDVLVAVGDDVSLNQERLSCDATDFTRALEEGDRARAVEVYAAGGAFLDGVHVADAPEFERWVDSVRAQLTTDYRRALEELANDATGSGRHNEAVTWWRRLSAEDRLSSRIALGLMRALADAGDLAGALEFARVHAAVLQAELECAPDPAVTAFADQLRARGSAPVSTSAKRAPARVVATENVSVPAVPAVPAVSAGPAVPRLASARRRASYVAGALALAVAAYGAMHLLNRDVASALIEAEPSIAVLPLDNIGRDSLSQSFADGLTEELIDVLAKTGKLRVIGSTSAFAFAGHHTDARRIADTLHVAYVLEGGLQRVGPRFRVGVRLVDGRTGSTRWSETYERETKDVFALQDEIGGAVAAELKVRLLAATKPHDVRRRTTNLAAYDFFLRGRHQRELRSDTGLRAAVEDFRRAIAADSLYAEAYAGLAEAFAILKAPGAFSPVSPREMCAEAQAAGEKAVALDESLPQAHAALGSVALNCQVEFAAAEAQFKRALELDPADRRTHESLAILYGSTERPGESLREARNAIDLDPLSVTAIRELGRALFSARRYDEALAQLERARTLGPAVRTAPLIAGEIYTTRKMYPQAIAAYGSLRRPPLPRLGFTLAKSGDRAAATRILADVTGRWQRGEGGAFDVAIVNAGLHDFDQAFLWLDRSFEDRSMNWGIMYPTFDDLRADPRFDRLRKRMGLPARR
jgi:serine/threonine-protein kinase